VAPEPGRRHVASLYDTDTSLVQQVADFVVEGMRDDAAIIIVATPEHRESFDAAIGDRGVDLVAARESGQYLALDAAQTLARFMADGSPDRARFRATIGSVIDAAAGSGREVRIYGEMVALLCADGNVAPALALEGLWNELAATRDFCLLCGYPIGAFGDARSDAFQQICGAHSSILPTARPATGWTRSASGPRETAGEPLPAIGTQLEVSLMAKVLGGLFLAGGTLAMLSILLPGPRSGNHLAVVGIVVNAWLVSAVLIRWARRMPRWILPVGLAWGSTLITGVAYFAGTRPSPLIFFYLWVFLYSAYFFTGREAAVQVALCGLAYGVLLALAPPTQVATWWIVAMGTLLVAAWLTWAMRQRAESLIGRLYDAARTDPLTKLLNRRGFRELLDLELERARRSKLPVTLVSGDLDHFKLVNDRAGHHVGDNVLQRAARVLESAKRQGDTLARVGGEEFALIAPDTDQGGALTLAERLRCAVLDEFSRDPVPVTISFGISSHQDHGETAAALLHAADDALYQAKESGRNRSVVCNRQIQSAAHRGARSSDVGGERFIAVMLDLAAVVDLRFSGAPRHSETVGRYAEMMARELGLPERRIGRVRLAGLLHDIGKVTLPDSILKKPGALDPDEREAVQTHPALGAQILEHASLADIRSWVAAHHERPDGQGYPHRLRGAQIPLEARILSVADAYEAMTSDRSYRFAIDQAAARAELERCARSQFDPAVVDALLAALDRSAAAAG
jgi:diguanylate cyclase (GGDEF)-like protein/putative nucleotidyltransferase with HDIG domain